MSIAQRLSTPPMQCKESFLVSLQAFMPHWTPTAPDNVVYATIKEAMSGSETDIEMYLHSLKQELHIGQEGYPTHVTLAGDQQTYAVMKKLKRKHPGHLDWVSIIPGDWHLMKLTSEVLRDLLWDGGLKEFAYECGYKKQPTQWQENNILLIATYIALLRKAVCVYCSSTRKGISSLMFYPSAFWKWLDLVRSTTNEDQVSRFWAEALHHLNSYAGYYFSIRSGNWLLRNSCLKAILPLFFANCRNKYEELSTTSVLDTLTFPQSVLTLSLNGQWTVSQKGRPYHNIAIDEAHECLINLRLKTITARPSHFRTVELANFMSYLDGVLNPFENLISRHRKLPQNQQKHLICQQVSRIYERLSIKDLFHISMQPVQLKNIFTSNPKELDTHTIYDLLNFFKIGTERMIMYIKEQVLPLPEGKS